jgi:O-antigen ligase
LAGLKKTLPFFLCASVVVLLYGLWQNIRYAYGLEPFAVMPGRPNSVFPEPDWFGLYLVLILSFCYAMLYYLSQKFAKNLKESARSFLLWFVYLTMIISLLIIAVSRSAWLGAAVSTVVFLVYLFSNFGLIYQKWKWQETIRMKLFILTSIICSLFLVYLFQLTTFQIFNRVQSVKSGEQKITVSCLENIALPKKIGSLDELNSFGCRHINLEEISAEKESGKYIREISRDDPNINIRAEIYGKAWQAIKAHPILGVGWENISPLLGRDGRGAYLNSSNIFLETWLGGGIIAFLSLLLLLAMILFRAFQKLVRTKSLDQKTFALFIILSWSGLVIFNLFNAGIMLGFFWLWLGISSLIFKKTDENRD